MALDETPDYLVPRLGELPVSSTRYYQSAAITHLIDDTPSRTGITEAMAVPRPGEVAKGSPAEGVLLTHEQAWVIEGIAMGPLLHSLCLAPGEITQIAVKNQTRRVRENSVDAGVQREDLASDSDQASDLSDDERSTTGEKTGGGTVAGSMSAATEAGSGGLFGLGASGGIGTNMAMSHQASVSVGHRSIASQANQSLHQTARDKARLARQQHTSSVREVSETESLEMKTRVVANYNHMHALTMQYYEADQVYQLQTRVVDAVRLLFVPMKRIDFSDATQTDRAIGRYREQLISTARDLGLVDVAAKLVRGRLSGTTIPTSSAEAGADERERAAAEQDEGEGSGGEDGGAAEPGGPLDLGKQLEAAKAQVASHRDTVISSEDRSLEARDEIRDAGDVGLAKRAKLQRKLAAATAELNAARVRLDAAIGAVRDLQDRIAEKQADDDEARRASQLDDEALRAILHEHELAFNQGLWLRLDPSTFAGILRNRVHDGERVADTVDPNPIAVSGHYVGFRWNFADLDAADDFRNDHLKVEEVLASVAVPTGGIFGEAVLGESNAAEKIDLTRFWNWSDALPPIRPAEIAALGAGEQAPLRAPTRQGVPESAVSLGQVKFPETHSGINDLAAVLSNPELFRDMSGKETTAALAESAMRLSSEGASTAGRLAKENLERFMGFQQKVASSLGSAIDQTGFDDTLAGGRLNHVEAERAGPVAAGGAGTNGSTESAGQDGEQTVVPFSAEFIPEETP